MTKLASLYRHSLSLVTDLYQLTMAYGYWKSGLAERDAVFHLFFRKGPFRGNYAVACGQVTAAEYLEDIRFDDSDLDYLATLTGNDGNPLFPPAFLDYLRGQPQVTDVLITGGDPMIMRADILRHYIEPLLGPGFEHIRTIRIGTKVLAFWP